MEVVARKYVGTDREHEVYEAEVIGLLMGLELLARERDVREAAIYIDNQAVIRTLQGGSTSNLGYLYEQLDEAVRRVREENVGIRLDTRWIPGHVGVEGNERADEAAKQAADKIDLTNHLLPDRLKCEIPVNPVAAKRTRRAGMDEEWKGWVKDEGTEARTTKFTNEIDDKYPSMHFYKNATNLTRLQFATLTQLRTGHYPTASYLFRFNLNDSPRCQHCDTQTETVAHLLKGCRALDGLRRERDRVLGAASRLINALLKPGEHTVHLIEYLQRVKKSASGGAVSRV